MKTRISFIGYGNMARAIAKGLYQQGFTALKAAAPSLASGIHAEGIDTYSDNKAVIQNTDLLILAVKPPQVKAVLAEIKPLLTPHCLLVSLAAGLDLAFFNQHLGAQYPLVRAMPNTAASIGLSATPLLANSLVSPLQKKRAEQVFASIGITTWVDKEEDIDSFTALSGSGPAYVFLFLEALTKAAVHLGLETTLAKTFALQTVQGAVQLAQQSDASLEELRQRVTSPKGTTAAALAVLHPSLDALLLEAMQAAKDRAWELGHQGK